MSPLLSLLPLLLLLSPLLSLCLAQVNSTSNVWLALVGQFQRDIGRDIPIHQLTLPCAHNAFNNPGNLPPLLVKYQNLLLFQGGVILQNQDLSMTQLLDLGVRHLELDVHYIPEYNQTLLCHGAIEPSLLCPIIEAGVGSTCKEAVGFDNLGQHTGCTLDASTWEQGIREIARWVEKNPEEYLWLEIEDQASIEDFAQENQIVDPLYSLLGSFLFTRTELEDFRVSNPDKIWPSPHEMLSNYKKTILLSGFGERFPSLQEINIDVNSNLNYPNNSAKYFEPETCNDVESNFTFFFESDIQVVIQLLGFDVRKTGHDDVGEINSKTLKNLLACGFSGCVDRISEESMVDTIWTWDQRSSQIACKDNLCPVLFAGSWQHALCNKTLFAACQNDADPFDWVLLEEPTTFDNVTCPDGFSFSFPVTPPQNEALKRVAGDEPIWLNVPLVFEPTHPVCSYIPISSSSTLLPSLLPSLLLLLLAPFLALISTP